MALKAIQIHQLTIHIHWFSWMVTEVKSKSNMATESEHNLGALALLEKLVMNHLTRSSHEVQKLRACQPLNLLAKCTRCGAHLLGDTVTHEFPQMSTNSCKASPLLLAANFLSLSNPTPCIPCVRVRPILLGNPSSTQVRLWHKLVLHMQLLIRSWSSPAGQSCQQPPGQWRSSQHLHRVAKQVRRDCWGS